MCNLTEGRDCLILLIEALAHIASPSEVGRIIIQLFKKYVLFRPANATVEATVFAEDKIRSSSFF